MDHWRLFLALAVIGVCCGRLAEPAAAIIHDDVVCWYPDVETPVACDDDDD